MATINLDDLKPNSHTYKESMKKETPTKDEKQKMLPVVQKGGVVSTKKPLSKKFADTFIQDDINDVKSYVLEDVIIPGIKNTILDVLSMMFFHESYRGGDRRYSKEEKYDYSARYKYKSNSSKRKKRDDDEDEYERNEKVDYRNIVLKNRSDAEDVVREMRKRIKDFDTVSVADLFDLIDVSGKYTDNNWGWDDPNEIGVRRVSNGYLIDVAEAKLLD